MLDELAFRFVIGGLVVSAFAVVGKLLRPQSFAGIFGAAPSVALATLGQTIVKHGGDYAVLEARSMLAGAVALGCYNAVVGWLLRKRSHALAASGGGWLLWLTMAFCLWANFLRGRHP
jgi:uncharacterized membrane protein (GlpM family)